MRLRLITANADNPVGVPTELGGVSSVLVSDDNGNPLAVMLERGDVADGHVFMKTAAEEDFGQFLRMFGIQTVTAFQRVRV